MAEACAAELKRGSGEAAIQRICTDSRQARAGDLFFAIKGERFDGHDFLDEVAARGVTAVAVEREKNPMPPPKCSVLIVDEARAALGRLAAAYRREFDLPVIAVGGSNGKTTVKELIASVLRQKLTTLWSEASFNNDIGVPLTLLRLEKSHQVAVLEAGTNHPGELAPLVKMIQPKYGVVTNIAREHLEFFGDVAGVAQEEGWLAELLPADGRLFVNGDNEWTGEIVRRTRAMVVRVGLGEKNDWRAKGIRLDKNGATFRVEAPKAGFSGEYRINLLGRHQVVNALFAVAVSEELGLGRPAVRDGLAECQPAKMRMQFWEAGGVRVLDDAYNANADSMVAALETLCALPLQGRRVAVLGDMAELGAQSEAAHAEVGRRAAELGIGQLFVIGRMAPVMAAAARAAGLSRVIEFKDVEAARNAVKTFLKAGDVVLLKASRALRLERIAETLKSEQL
ncbi:MAG TPA: UDP-N-acetylmuramoyl-tripeptide--D-alanyl-D-alanine ligase [Verrucomicrobiae bacterium]|nr:UDP-N-acetylmuramoyl-tripeptide--D-alanyl-D-alanine ligase [Verrucomicrobiae bacterium]